jgi:hypothetical protein
MSLSPDLVITITDAGGWLSIVALSPLLNGVAAVSASDLAGSIRLQQTL